MFCSRCGTQVQQEAAKYCPSCGLDLSSATIGGGTPTVAIPVERSDFDVVRDTLKDEYELLQELGRGGMAIVFKARDRSLDREVAIKVLPFSLAFDKDFVERFQREARTSARLEHPHIIPIYRVGRTEQVIYFVMKFLRGTSLSEVLESKGPLPAPQIRQLLAQTARALHYAHTHDIVHRDIKPDNIMFDELGHAIVTDFGIAKAASGTRLTGTGMSIGTPHYMSPEQARAQALDGRSDIYSLGVVAYQCLTGKVPFDGDDSYSIGYKHIMDELPTPPLKGVDQWELFEIIRRMMAKSPEERFQDAEQLAQVLEGKAPLPTGPLSSAAPTVAMKAAPAELPPAGRTARAPSTPTTPIPRTEYRAGYRPAPKKRSGALVSLLLLLGGGGAGGYWYFFMGPGKAVTAAPLPGSASVALADTVGPPVDSAVPPDSVTLAAAPDSVAAAPALEQPPASRTGILVVRGAPIGARIRLNADPPTPADSFVVHPGQHKIVIAAAGFEDFSTSIPVAPGEKIVVPVVMTRVSVPAGRPAPPRPVATGTPQPSGPPPHCDVPTTPGYNLGDICFDTRPALEAPFVPIPDGVEGIPTPSIIWVYVSADGRALRVSQTRPSNNPQFHLAAMQHARTVQYRPAQKNGVAVAAWAQFQFPPQR